jgi:abortive infection bacteriophage resistance protein|nr:MAG TPA: Abi-like protein [Caudoviricetes sp.]
MKEPKKFFTYEEQIELLKNKKLIITDEQRAINYLKQYSYYSLISGYKDIFKVEKNGNYRPDARFEHIVLLYQLDNMLKYLFLQKIINIEKHIKSLYSYSFCSLYGETQDDYLNVNNYNYIPKYQSAINDYVSLVSSTLKNSEKYPNINYNIKTYGTVPLWIVIHSLTFGNISKLYSFSMPKVQSEVSREFKGIYSNQLSAILNVLTKYRNVCAHGERLYNYRTQKSLLDLPLHSQIKGLYNISKNDLFNVCISFKYLLPKDNFDGFIDDLSFVIQLYFEKLDDYYRSEILKCMGFPDDWKEILLN